MGSVLCRSPACHSACRTQVDVRVCSLSYSRDIDIHFDLLVIKTFPNVSLSGVRNSPTVQRVSLTPSQALSKPTSSYVSFLSSFPAPLLSIHIHPTTEFTHPPLVIPLPPLPPCRAPPFDFSILPFWDGDARQTQTSCSTNTMSKRTWIFCTKW